MMRRIQTQQITLKTLSKFWVRFCAVTKAESSKWPCVKNDLTLRQEYQKREEMSLGHEMEGTKLLGRGGGAAGEANLSEIFHRKTTEFLFKEFSGHVWLGLSGLLFRFSGPPLFSNVFHCFSNPLHVLIHRLWVDRQRDPLLVEALFLAI